MPYHLQKPRSFASVVLGCWLLVGLLLLADLAAAQERETLRETYDFPNPNRPHLTVDNIDGDVTVRPHDGRGVALVLRQSFRGDDAAAVQRARREITFEVETRGDTLVLMQDAPWRYDRDRGRYGRRDDCDCAATFDFELRVPRATYLKLSTVNNGDVTVEGTTGGIHANNINGAVTLDDVAGPVRAYALNHPLTVTFRENPTSDSYFGSLNGDIRVTFRPGLSADMRAKTFNGEVFSAFNTQPLPLQATVTSGRRGTKYAYRAEGYSAYRIGRGGPTLTFDAFNGDTFLLKTDR